MYRSAPKVLYVSISLYFRGAYHRLKYLETGGLERTTLLVASEFIHRSEFDDLLGSLGCEVFLSVFLLDGPALVIWIF